MAASKLLSHSSSGSYINFRYEDRLTGLSVFALTKRVLNRVIKLDNGGSALLMESKEARPDTTSPYLIRPLSITRQMTSSVRTVRSGFGKALNSCRMAPLHCCAGVQSIFFNLLLPEEWVDFGISAAR